MTKAIMEKTVEICICPGEVKFQITFLFFCNSMYNSSIFNTQKEVQVPHRRTCVPFKPEFLQVFEIKGRFRN